jgi:asparagine synthase (glutamine-hydrolysing)
VLQRTLAADLGSPLANDMLTKVDRASMRWSVEARVPFLDHRVAEIGLGLPREYSLGRRGKEVLRRLFERRFGAKLAKRPKQGFGVPVEKWLRGPLAPTCDRLFDEARVREFGLLDAGVLGRGRWRTLGENNPIALWHAFALSVWCEANHGLGADAVREFLQNPATAGGP